MKYLSLFILNIFSIAALAQSDTTHVFDCRGKKYSLKLPKELFSNVSEFSYTEGFFISLIYKDSSYIQLHCGGSVRSQFSNKEKFVVQDSSTAPGVKSRWGLVKETRLHWREDRFQGKDFSISFINVPDKRKKLFIKTLDDFRLTIK